MSLSDFILGHAVLLILIVAGCICSWLVTDDDEPTGDKDE